MTTLHDAVLMLDERKKAVWGGERSARDGADGDVTRRMFSGSGIDPDEAWELAHTAAEVVAGSVLRGEVAAADSLAAAWLDGVLAGAMFARMAAERARERTP